MRVEGSRPDLDSGEEAGDRRDRGGEEQRFGVVGAVVGGGREGLGAVGFCEGICGQYRQDCTVV